MDKTSSPDPTTRPDFKAALEEGIRRSKLPELQAGPHDWQSAEIIRFYTKLIEESRIDETTVKLARAEWAFLNEKLGSYDSSIPTGTYVGKRWMNRRRGFPPYHGLYMAEFREHADPEVMGIHWRKVDPEYFELSVMAETEKMLLVPVRQCCVSVGSLGAVCVLEHSHAGQHQADPYWAGSMP